jgi:hypothetical protein
VAMSGRARVPKTMQRPLLILICAVARNCFSARAFLPGGFPQSGVFTATEVYAEFDPQYFKEATAAITLRANYAPEKC